MLRRRGEIDVWLSDEAISLWYEKDRIYDGTGAPKRFSVLAILQSSPAMKYDRFIACLFDKPKVLLILYFGL